MQKAGLLTCCNTVSYTYMAQLQKGAIDLVETHAQNVQAGQKQALLVAIHASKLLVAISTLLVPLVKLPNGLLIINNLT